MYDGNVKIGNIFMAVIHLAMGLSLLLLLVVIFFTTGNILLASFIMGPLTALYFVLARFCTPLVGGFFIGPIVWWFIITVPATERRAANEALYITENNTALTILRRGGYILADKQRNPTLYHQDISYQFWENVRANWEASPQYDYTCTMKYECGDAVDKIHEEWDQWFKTHEYPQDGAPPVPTAQYVAEWVARRAGGAIHPESFYAVK